MAESNNRAVERVLTGMPATDGAGVRMTRVIATPELDHFDPFLLLDEFRSDDPDDYIAGFPDHPHRGFETVTYMLAGSMKHADNKGNAGLLGPGSVQWMTAGRGIVHSEMPQQEDGLMWGFQLWVNRPAKDKMCEPRYQDIPASDVPSVSIGEGASAKLIAGEFEGVKGPIEDVTTEPLYVDLHIDRDGQASIPMPAGHNAFVYVYDGSVSVIAKQSRIVSRGEIALLGEGDQLTVQADNTARLILVAGRPLNEPIARYGPFVMNTEQEIRQAMLDRQAGRF
mgnify:CR=1 FL=1